MIIRIFLCFFGLISSISYSSLTFASYFSKHRFYTGAGVGIGSTNFKAGYGDGFVPSVTSETEVFWGARNLNRFGFELGGSFSPEHEKYVRLDPGAGLPGIPNIIPANEWEVWYTTFKTRSFYAGVNRYIGINGSNSIQLFGFAGLTLEQVKATIQLNYSSEMLTPSTSYIAETQRNFAATKVIPLVKLGLNFDFGKSWGLRILYVWKDYARFTSIKSKEQPNGRAELKLKDSQAVHLDFFIQI